MTKYGFFFGNASGVCYLTRHDVAKMCRNKTTGKSTTLQATSKKQSGFQLVGIILKH